MVFNLKFHLWALVFKRWGKDLDQGNIEKVRADLRLYEKNMNEDASKDLGPHCPACNGTGLQRKQRDPELPPGDRNHGARIL